jgi:hypothetical protein
MSRCTAWCTIAAVVLFARPAAAAPRLAVDCGGFPLPYGTTIGAVGPRSGPNRPSSVMAVAAVTSGNDLRPVAWAVWDERAFAWLAIDNRTPAALRNLWAFKTPPDFRGPGLQIRFTPLSRALPGRFQLTDCPSVMPSP